MINLDLNNPLISLNNEAMKNDDGSIAILAKILANNLTGVTPGIETVKAMAWAYDLWKTGMVEIDIPDYEKLYNYVSNLGISNIIKLQLMDRMKAQKEEK